MHVTAKKLVMSGMFLAVSMICMMLGSVIQTNTLFLLAAASYFVGIVLRECGGKLGVAFYVAAILLGWMLVPEKLYVGSYAAMGLYILLEDRLWDFLVLLWEMADLQSDLSEQSGRNACSDL